MPLKKLKTANHTFRTWHRRLGLATCLLLIVLALSGVLINHAHQMGLDQRGVKISWLLDYYGIGQPRNIMQFSQDPASLIAIDNQLWLDQQFLLESTVPVLAAVWYQQQIIAIDAKQLYIFDRQGQLLETQNDSSGLTPPLVDLSISAKGEPLLSTQHGLLIADEQLLDWQSVDANDTAVGDSSMSQATTINPDLLIQARSRHLTWERVILDLHSGRLFGAWALWLWDFVALVILFLSLSGLWMWRHKKFRR
ncbi:PepSY-associated TM helix domain-containing protein [Paraglaciecola sp.]|uniref:PepSY-associated TM helix domain-containing protein n=1 Tax=Paraglaciecola sp. TaxID=1920173 RepID=UPI0030F3A522